MRKYLIFILCILCLILVLSFISIGDEENEIIEAYTMTMFNPYKVLNINTDIIKQNQQVVILNKNNQIEHIESNTNNNITNNNTDMIFPLSTTDKLKWSGRCSSKFGWRKLTIDDDWNKHTGIDLPADIGADIYASLGGKVVESNWNRLRGWQILIQHNNEEFYTRYQHNSKNLVKVGDIVNKGDVIGKVGSTGRSTAPHLHFEVLIGGKEYEKHEYNPAFYIPIPNYIITEKERQDPQALSK